MGALKNRTQTVSSLVSALLSHRDPPPDEPDWTLSEGEADGAWELVSAHNVWLTAINIWTFQTDRCMTLRPNTLLAISGLPELRQFVFEESMAATIEEYLELR